MESKTQKFEFTVSELRSIVGSGNPKSYLNGLLGFNIDDYGYRMVKNYEDAVRVCPPAPDNPQLPGRSKKSKDALYRLERIADALRYMYRFEINNPPEKTDVLYTPKFNIVRELHTVPTVGDDDSVKICAYSLEYSGVKTCHNWDGVCSPLSLSFFSYGLAQYFGETFIKEWSDYILG